MTKEDVEGVVFAFMSIITIWIFYASAHSDDKYIPAINLVLIGVTWLMLWGYVLFS